MASAPISGWSPKHGHPACPGVPVAFVVSMANHVNDPVGAALVCGWDPGDAGLNGFQWATVVDAPDRRDAIVRLEHGRNQLIVHEDDGFAAVAAACAGKLAVELLEAHGLRPDSVDAVVAAPFDAAFIDELAPHIAVASDRFIRPEAESRFHTAGLIAAMAQMVARTPAPGGECILLVAAGAGISAGAALLVR